MCVCIDLLRIIVIVMYVGIDLYACVWGCRIKRTTVYESFIVRKKLVLKNCYKKLLFKRT